MIFLAKTKSDIESLTEVVNNLNEDILIFYIIVTIITVFFMTSIICLYRQLKETAECMNGLNIDIKDGYSRLSQRIDVVGDNLLDFRHEDRERHLDIACNYNKLEKEIKYIKYKCLSDEFEDDTSTGNILTSLKDCTICIKDADGSIYELKGEDLVHRLIKVDGKNE